jgi:hypothetical protein
MSLINQAKLDAQRYTSDLKGFGVAITLTALNQTVLETVGLHTKHHIGIDTDGNTVNTKNAHIAISEENLIAASYPYRDASGEVNLYSHRVTVADSSGSNKEYIIREFFPDETIGLIVCILGDYE